MYVCVCVLTINGGADVSGLPKFDIVTQSFLIRERAYALKNPLLNS